MPRSASDRNRPVFSKTFSYEAPAKLGPGLLDQLADECIVLTMANRRDDVLASVRERPPHRRLFVQDNIGYKEKAKIDAEAAPRDSKEDIANALAQAFHRSLGRGVERLLVLEDDFFFDPDESDEDLRLHAGRVAEFMEGRDYDIYNLGRLVFSGWPVGASGSWRAWRHGTAHAVVYHKRYMKLYLREYNADPSEIHRMSVDNWWHRWGVRAFVYHRALLYQTFPVTTNQSTWSNPVTMFGIRMLRLDSSHRPGYPVLNALCKTSLPLLLVLVAGSVALLVRGVQVFLRRRAARRAAEAGDAGP